LDFVAESLDQVFVDDAVRGGKEGKDVGDEMSLIIVELVLPIVQILGEVNLFGGPEAGFSLKT
jgi:hypothetical protein